MILVKIEQKPDETSDQDTTVFSTNQRRHAPRYGRRTEASHLNRPCFPDIEAVFLEHQLHRRSIQEDASPTETNPCRESGDDGFHQQIFCTDSAFRDLPSSGHGSRNGRMSDTETNTRRLPFCKSDAQTWRIPVSLVNLLARRDRITSDLVSRRTKRFRVIELMASIA